MENNSEESFLQMHVDYEGGQILRETVRWSRFLSVAGIIGLAVCLLVVALPDRRYWRHSPGWRPASKRLEASQAPLS